jgi:signal transduction histidine kinase
VWIRARRDNAILYCLIRDDGAGFDIPQGQKAPRRKGLGLIAMSERVTAIGGTLHIESRPGHGTELSIRLPLEGNHANSHLARG